MCMPFCGPCCSLLLRLLFLCFYTVLISFLWFLFFFVCAHVCSLRIITLRIFISFVEIHINLQICTFSFIACCLLLLSCRSRSSLLYCRLSLVFGVLPRLFAEDAPTVDICECDFLFDLAASHFCGSIVFVCVFSLPAKRFVNSLKHTGKGISKQCMWYDIRLLIAVVVVFFIFFE